MRYRFRAAFLSLLAVTSCRGSEHPAPTADSEFQERVVWGQDRPPQRALRVTMTYCEKPSSNSGCVDLENGRPTDAFLIANGHVVFFDQRAGLVAFDSVGRYVAHIGSLGTEPGSYRRVTALGSNAAGTFTFWDPFLDRLTVLKLNEPPRAAWVKDGRVESVLISDTFAVALAVPPSRFAGDRVAGTIMTLNSNGKFSNPLAAVTALATTSKRLKARAPIPNLHWPNPIWGMGLDGTLVYVPPDTVLRIEFYDRSGRPEMLVVGDMPFPSEIVTEAELGRLKEIYYETIKGEPMPQPGSCSLDVPPPGASEPNKNCVLVRHAHEVGRRSPRIRPPVTDIVSFAPRGFWVRTSRIRKDSATWLMADSSGKLFGWLELKAAERPIGQHRARFAIADTTDGRTSVTWRELIQ